MKAVLILFWLTLGTGLDNHSQTTAGQTLRNLENAYQAEANSYKRYSMFAKKAMAERYGPEAKFFRALSKSASIHMNNHKAAILEMGGTPGTLVYHQVDVKPTKENLRNPIEGESRESGTSYPQFLKAAQQENAQPAIKTFTYAAQAEAQHEKLFKEAHRRFGKNKRIDYYVSSLTGATIAVPQGNSPPQPVHQGERFLKIQ